MTPSISPSASIWNSAHALPERRARTWMEDRFWEEEGAGIIRWRVTLWGRNTYVSRWGAPERVVCGCGCADSVNFCEILASPSGRKTKLGAFSWLSPPADGVVIAGTCTTSDLLLDSNTTGITNRGSSIVQADRGIRREGMRGMSSKEMEEVNRLTKFGQAGLFVFAVGGLGEEEGYVGDW
ncbi:hypothetical protein BDZ91DRAFT_761773 [Kalaharituber pfeilii]|nr:hypothetical protein BDZ91DRAFT_761773 [Kalaharituber pfeilii]